VNTDILKPNTGYLTVERPAKSTPDQQSGILSPAHYVEPVSEGEEGEEMDLIPARDEDRSTGLPHETSRLLLHSVRSLSRNAIPHLGPPGVAALLKRFVMSEPHC
jgi:hypothetical protein